MVIQFQKLAPASSTTLPQAISPIDKALGNCCWPVAPLAGVRREKQEVSRDAPEAQLYHLEQDPHEEHNLIEREPAIATQLLAQLTNDIKSGRSTPGRDAKNDIDDIVIWKSRRSTAPTSQAPGDQQP